MDGVEELMFALACSKQQRARRRRRRAVATSAVAMGQQPAPVSATQHHGSLAEKRAALYLKHAGLALLATNLRCKAGEIDLLMRDGDVLVFVEVRSRNGTEFGGALASVGYRKRGRLIRTARYFLHTSWQGDMPRCRFDVVAFEGSRCVWVRDAFGETL